MTVVDTGITDHDALPDGLVAVLAELLTENAPIGTKVQHYAGEFLAEDNLNALKASLSQFDHVFYDIELINEEDNDSTETMPDERFSFLIFAVTTNFFDESIQWKSSYGLAWKLKNILQGVKVTNGNEQIHGSGYFEFGSIERELHIPGMSVHTLRVDLPLAHDSNR